MKYGIQKRRWHSQFSYFKKTLHRRRIIKSYLSGWISCQGKVYLRRILHLDYEFRLRYILLDFNWKSYGQQFITTFVRYFPAGMGFEND